jgi:hypothetical protein
MVRKIWMRKLTPELAWSVWGIDAKVSVIRSQVSSRLLAQYIVAEVEHPLTAKKC